MNFIRKGKYLSRDYRLLHNFETFELLIVHRVVAEREAIYFSGILAPCARHLNALLGLVCLHLNPCYLTKYYISSVI